MSQLNFTNDTNNTPLTLTEPGSGQPYILRSNGGSVTYDDLSPGRYTVEENNSPVLTLSVRTPLKAKIDVAVAVPGGTPGGVITFRNAGGPPYTVNPPASAIVVVGGTRAYADVGDCVVTFPNDTNPLIVTFPGTFNITLDIIPAEV